MDLVDKTELDFFTVFFAWLRTSPEGEVMFCEFYVIFTFKSLLMEFVCPSSSISLLPSEACRRTPLRQLIDKSLSKAKTNRNSPFGL